MKAAAAAAAKANSAAAVSAAVVSAPASSAPAPSTAAALSSAPATAMPTAINAVPAVVPVAAVATTQQKHNAYFVSLKKDGLTIPPLDLGRPGKEQAFMDMFKAYALGKSSSRRGRRRIPHTS